MKRCAKKSTLSGSPKFRPSYKPPRNDKILLGLLGKCTLFLKGSVHFPESFGTKVWTIEDVKMWFRAIGFDHFVFLFLHTKSSTRPAFALATKNFSFQKMTTMARYRGRGDQQRMTVDTHDTV